MSTTIEIPKFWLFHCTCGAPFGAIIADQTFGGKASGPIIATPEQAWDEFYDRKNQERNAARKRGVYVTASETIDALGTPHADDCPTEQ